MHGTTRRQILTSGAGLIAAGLAAGAWPFPAAAQSAGAAADAADLARLRAARRVVVRGGIVLTLDRQVGDFARADVLIEDGKIREIGPDIAASGDTAVVDAAGRIVMPGLIDTHHHFYQGILRSILPNGRLVPDYFRDIGNALTPAYEPADVYAGTLISALGMMSMGTTTAIDTSQCSHTPEHTDAGIAALREAGMRVVYAYWTGNGPKVQYPTDSARLQRTYFSSQDQLLTLALGALLDPKVFAYARDAGLRCVSHGVDAKREPKLHELSQAGLLRAGDVFIHCNDLSDPAWTTLHDSGAKVSLAPTIEMTMGHGTPGIQGALDHGMRPSLSSDVDATIASDLFSIMRTALSFQRFGVQARERHGEKDTPPLLTSRDVLEFATIEGARACGLDARTGSLIPGKDADLILLRTDGLDIWPVNNAAGAVVNLMNPGHVEAVFVAGQVKKWRGELVGVDVPRVRRLAETARDAVVQRAKFQLDIMRP